MRYKDTEVGKIPIDWEMLEMSDSVDILMGQSPKSEFYNNQGEGIPFMQGRKTFGDKYHEIDTWCTEPKKLARKNDILMSVRAPVGDLNIAKMDLCIGRGLASLTMKNENNEYLYYLLKNYKDILMNKGSGTIFTSVNKKDLETLRLPFASSREQKSMAHIFSTLDDKIENNNKINKTLEEIASQIFKHWFVDFEFPNEEGQPYKSSGGKMVESKMGMIPKGWKVGKLGNLINIRSGKRPINKSELCNEEFPIPIVGASSVMGYCKDYNINQSVLIMGRVGTHGIVQRFSNRVWASDNTLIIETGKYEYVYQVLNLIDYRSLNRGSTQPLITQTDIKNYNIVLSEESVFNKYEQIAGALFKLNIENIKENQKLSNLRDTLLPKLMSGQIRVPLESEDDTI